MGPNGDRGRAATGIAAGPPALAAASGGAPATASARAYLRSGLPAIYHDGDLGMRFVAALETVLDPVVAILDSLEHHVEADLAPPDMLELLAAWLGIQLDESWPEERRRDAVRRAGELHRRRGARAGLELALAIGFPDLPLRVEDAGSVTWSRSPDGDGAAAPGGAEGDGFVVYCDVPLEEPASLAQVIEGLRPAHVRWRLRVRTDGEAAR